MTYTWEQQERKNEVKAAFKKTPRLILCSTKNTFRGLTKPPDIQQPFWRQQTAMRVEIKTFFFFLNASRMRTRKSLMQKFSIRFFPPVFIAWVYRHVNLARICFSLVAFFFKLCSETRGPNFLKWKGNLLFHHTDFQRHRGFLFISSNFSLFVNLLFGFFFSCGKRSNLNGRKETKNAAIVYSCRFSDDEIRMKRRKKNWTD